MERIILDVDSAGDDILAVLFAAAHPDIKLEAVTTVTGAAGPIEQVTDVVLNTPRLPGATTSRSTPARGGRSSAIPRPTWKRRCISRSGSPPASVTG